MRHRNADSPSIRSHDEKNMLRSTTFKRPPTPELIQDLSVKRRSNSGESSDGSESSRRMTSPFGMSHNHMDAGKTHSMGGDAPLDLTAPAGKCWIQNHLLFEYCLCKGVFTLTETEINKNGLYKIVWQCSIK